MQRWALLLTLLSVPASARAMPRWSEDLGEARAAASGKKSLVLVDFYAPWCYSCYYMDQHVLHQPELASLSSQLELAKVDVDSLRGAELRREWTVRMLPSYLILDSDGRELGRILGEQTRVDFFSQLRGVIERHSPLPELRKALAAAKETPAALPLARRLLELHSRRGSFAEGLADFEAMPPGLRAGVEKDAEASLFLLRLRLEKARIGKETPKCLELGRALLARKPDCSLPYDTSHLDECVKGLPDSERRPLLERERGLLGPLLEEKGFAPPGRRCADLRSLVERGAELELELGRPQEAQKLLARGVDLLRAELGEDLARDRNKADTLRGLLDMAKRHEDLEALYPRLIAAYPKDYVYAYRFGRFLLERGRPAEALARLDAAARLAYGSNRLKVTELRAKALAALGRPQDALKQIESVWEDNPASFPEEIASLRRLHDELSRAPSKKS